jgi:hypothetical protein
VGHLIACSCPGKSLGLSGGARGLEGLPTKEKWALVGKFTLVDWRSGAVWRCLHMRDSAAKHSCAAFLPTLHYTTSGARIPISKDEHLVTTTRCQTERRREDFAGEKGIEREDMAVAATARRRVPVSGRLNGVAWYNASRDVPQQRSAFTDMEVVMLGTMGMAASRYRSVPAVGLRLPSRWGGAGPRTHPPVVWLRKHVRAGECVHAHAWEGGAASALVLTHSRVATETGEQSSTLCAAGVPRATCGAVPWHMWHAPSMPQGVRAACHGRTRPLRRDWLFDCGEGTQRQIVCSRVMTALQVERVFITHMHGDHVFGLPGLLCSHLMPFVGPSTTVGGPVHVYGPRGIAAFVAATVSQAGAVDGASRKPPVVVVHELLQASHRPSRPPGRVGAIEYVHVPANAEGVFPRVAEAAAVQRGRCAFAVDAVPIKHTVPCLGYVVSELPRTGTVNMAKVRTAG